MKLLKNVVAAVVVASAMAMQTFALHISPGTELESEDDPNDTKKIIAYLNTLGYDLGIASYKAEAPSGTEEGSDFDSSYKTTFNGSLSGGTIEWTGGSFISDANYLLVKDG